ncbi:phage terminase small subunit P27 family [Micromonospora sp. NPDC049101]|uniref:phage terminase small subunit P27 family n=1 Tax=Micromonospora sp. NPDC049101 TaxID=3155032 RepID=UPI0033C80FB7
MRNTYATGLNGKGVTVARDRKPPELTILHGNPSNNPTPTKAKSQTGRPRPPGDLKGEAFAEWSRITTYLEKVGRIEMVDYAALVVYCSSWQAFNDARLALEEHGTVVTGRDGGLVKNPAAQVMKDSSATMLNYGQRFGFTPKDRQNLGIGAESTAEDDLERHLGAL